MKARACILIFNQQSEILLIRRFKNGRRYWVTPGGSIENGETAEQAATRELLEETSLSAQNLSLAFTHNNNSRQEFYFMAHGVSGEAKLGTGPEQIRQSVENRYELVWVSKSQLAEINLQPAEVKNHIRVLLAA